jgi:ABC-type phosphate transport system ATPase subunit|tara:strand:+ start:271 stop:435 length:165 start_codon:yes stop_codon:yes gene_type:complete
MAIMGSSGCGKTSFLNVLGQRLGLSPGCTFKGEIRVNDKKLRTDDFGKFGAFVQ